jgi:DTW domain-containing protein YfiP
MVSSNHPTMAGDFCAFGDKLFKKMAATTTPPHPDHQSPPESAALPHLGEESTHEKDCRRIIDAKRLEFIEAASKCDDCWQKKKYCICSEMKRLVSYEHQKLYSKFRFIVYMSREEYLCGGNSGHLLSLMFPEQTSTYLYGCRDDSLLLRQVILKSEREGGKVCVLFPGSDAITVGQWMNTEFEKNIVVEGSGSLSCGGGGGGEGVNSDILSVILVDGTWRQARKMAKYLKSTLLPQTKHVTLTLSGESLVSSFHRKQSQAGRICTIEALSLFVAEVLAQQTQSSTTTLNHSHAQILFESIIKQSLEISSSALAPVKDPVLWIGSGGSPCWYYGDMLTEGELTLTSSEPSHKSDDD